LFARLFPAASLPALNVLSQIAAEGGGLSQPAQHRRSVYPGLALARPLRILAPSSPELPFSLLIAISMSITAFPVLARILADQNLSATKLGHVAIACLTSLLFKSRP
jgi:hypothetical protein